jgi:hypothetical protein
MCSLWQELKIYHRCDQCDQCDLLRVAQLEIITPQAGGMPLQTYLFRPQITPIPLIPPIKGVGHSRLVGVQYAPSMWQLFKEFLSFLREEKKWWLAPLVIVLLILGVLIVFSSGSVLAPLMYPFM